MPSDTDDYTPPNTPEGYVEVVNEQGETVWRMAALEVRRQSRESHQRDAFLMLKLSGLVATLGTHPRITLPALVVLLFAVQRDRTIGQPLKINSALIAESRHSRHALGRAGRWLEENLAHFVTVSRAPGKATLIGITSKGRQALHPRTYKGVRK